MADLMAVSYDEFHWRSAPLSHGPTVTLVAVWYVLLALLAKRACDQRTPPKTTSASYVLAAHSAVLAVASLVMCAGALREAFARSALEGSWSWFFCENRRAAPKLYFWAYAYYLSKYYELLDTFLPVAVHGRVPRHFGMHVFHHAAVLFMAWGYLAYRQSLAFGGLCANTAVHVVMYARGPGAPAARPRAIAAPTLVGTTRPQAYPLMLSQPSSSSSTTRGRRRRGRAARR